MMIFLPNFYLPFLPAKHHAEAARSWIQIQKKMEDEEMSPIDPSIQQKLLSFDSMQQQHPHNHTHIHIHPTTQEEALLLKVHQQTSNKKRERVIYCSQSSFGLFQPERTTNFAWSSRRHTQLPPYCTVRRIIKCPILLGSVSVVQSK